jgi:ketosteroid isomerase-like protein
MRKITTLAMIVLTCGWLAGCASVAAERDGAAAWARDEAQIREAMMASEQAFNRGDLKGHLAIYAPSVTFMTKDGPRVGVAPIEKAFSGKYFHDGKPIQQLSLQQLAVRPIGRDGALVTGKYVLSGGGQPDRSGWFTTVWQRTPEGWRCIHDHSS